jgi:3',5'-cyclic AMP phosphodiesterase CpdA
VKVRDGMSFRLVQISDPHLSLRRPFFQHNWEVLVEHLAAAKPDLIVCSGDMTIDGADHASELDFAAAQFRRLGSAVLCVPGNHDIGNSLPDVRGGETVITAARRAAYRRRFGDDFWTRDVAESWRLVGLNAMLPGSFLPAAAEQDAMLAAAIASRGARKLIVVAHKPLYVGDPADPTPSQSALYPEHRARWHALLHDAAPLVLTGHIHEMRVARWGRIRQVWAPSTAFVMDAAGRRRKRHGVRRPGYVLHSLTGRRHRCDFVEPEGFLVTDLANWFRDPAGFHARYAREPLRGLVLAPEDGA